MDRPRPRPRVERRHPRHPARAVGLAARSACPPRRYRRPPASPPARFLSTCSSPPATSSGHSQPTKPPAPLTRPLAPPAIPEGGTRRCTCPHPSRCCGARGSLCVPSASTRSTLHSWRWRSRGGCTRSSSSRRLEACTKLPAAVRRLARRPHPVSASGPRGASGSRTRRGRWSLSSTPPAAGGVSLRSPPTLRAPDRRWWHAACAPTRSSPSTWRVATASSSAGSLGRRYRGWGCTTTCARATPSLPHPAPPPPPPVCA
mmetsp:Transcript_11559/g.37013  ORF Transcript_11559/g.37013 Transcript_11559/m.37013 type:complete len:259 (+) Transcript_11559:1331-2107(+)